MNYGKRMRNSRVSNKRFKVTITNGNRGIVYIVEVITYKGNLNESKVYEK